MSCEPYRLFDCEYKSKKNYGSLEEFSPKLRQKNIIDSPQCVCGSIEDTHLYLFVCQQFANLRRELLNSVSDICHPNLNVLLHGDPSLSFDKNKKIFQAVQDFIMKTKRFE